MYLRSSILATACLGFVAPWAAAAPIPDLSFDASNPGTTPNDVWDDEQGTSFRWNLDDSAQLVTVNDPSAPTVSHAYSSPAAVGTSDASTNAAIYQGTPLENNEDVTLEFFILPPNSPGSQTIFETGGSNGAALYLRPRGTDFSGGVPDADDDDRFQVAWRVNQGNIGATNTDEARSQLVQESQLGEWVHITAVLDVDQGLTLYLDGVERATYDFPAGETLTSWSGGNGAGLGTINSDAPQFNFGDFEGEIAFARFYQEALTSDDASELYQQVIPEPGSFAFLGLGSMFMLRRARRNG